VSRPLPSTCWNLLIADDRNGFSPVWRADAAAAREGAKSPRRPPKTAAMAAPSQVIAVPCQKWSDSPATAALGTVLAGQGTAVAEIAHSQPSSGFWGAHRLHIHLDEPRPKRWPYLSAQSGDRGHHCDATGGKARKQPRIKGNIIAAGLVATQTSPLAIWIGWPHIDVDEFIPVPGSPCPRCWPPCRRYRGVTSAPAELLAWHADR